MNYLRSLLFNILFYSWTFLCCVIFLPTMVLPMSFGYYSTRTWACGVFWILDNIVGLHHSTVGLEKIPQTPVILASKHQSAWETIVFATLFSNPAFVLKKELLSIPFFGWYLKKLGMVPLSRSRKHGREDLKRLQKSADTVIQQGRHIVIFPEGTRSLPGEDSSYHSGVASLYHHLKIPVIPVAHNAGVFWPRKSFLKHRGTITLEFLDPIEPGLPPGEFMRILKERIETKTTDLIQEGKTYVS